MKETHVRIGFRIVGGLLIACSAGVAVFWFYWAVPIRHAVDPRWRLSHTQAEFWTETQKRIRRFGIEHDDPWIIGQHGDKAWAEMIFERVKPGDNFASCAGHWEIALSKITNHDLGTNANAWIDWWKTNRHKPQDEWIRLGFAELGISVSSPPATNTVIALLKTMGSAEAGIAFNAYRFLKTNRFDALTFDYSQVAAEEFQSVARGVAKYAILDYPARSDEFIEGGRDIPILYPNLPAAAGLIVLGCAGIGIWLFRFKRG